MKIIRYTKLFYLEKHSFNFTKRQFNSNSLKKLSSSLLPNEGGSDQPHYLKNKFSNLVAWYEQLTGMDEVRMMQKRVLEAQDKFVDSQDKRREASRELLGVQSKLKELYAELDTTSRGEERYLQLITQEHAVLKEERKLQSEFSLLEREERDTFTLLSNCVKESHEKERAQAERTKYWSVIGSVIGTIIGILGSSINNEFKMRELRNLVKDTSLKNMSNPSATLLLSKHEQELSSIVTEMKSIIHKYLENREAQVDHGVVRRLDQLLHTVGQKYEEDGNNFINQSMQNLSQNVLEVKAMLTTAQRFDGQLVTIPSDFESLIHAQRLETRMVLVGATIIGIFIPVFVSYILR